MCLLTSLPILCPYILLTYIHIIFPYTCDFDFTSAQGDFHNSNNDSFIKAIKTTNIHAKTNCHIKTVNLICVHGILQIPIYTRMPTSNFAEHFTFRKIKLTGVKHFTLTATECRTTKNRTQLCSPNFQSFDVCIHVRVYTCKSINPKLLPTQSSQCLFACERHNFSHLRTTFSYSYIRVLRIYENAQVYVVPSKPSKPSTKF